MSALHPKHQGRLIILEYFPRKFFPTCIPSKGSAFSRFLRRTSISVHGSYFVRVTSSGSICHALGAHSAIYFYKREGGLRRHRDYRDTHASMRMAWYCITCSPQSTASLMLRDLSFITLGSGAGWNLKTGQQLCTPCIILEKFSYPIRK